MTSTPTRASTTGRRTPWPSCSRPWTAAGPSTNRATRHARCGRSPPPPPAPPAQARAAVLSTEPDDGRPQPLDQAKQRKLLRMLPPARRRRLARALETTETRPDLRAHLDSLVWIDATEALEVGAGRPAVRAASIKALDTLRDVTQTNTRVAGVDALRVSFPDGPVRETIWLDARTGVPIQERDGNNSTTTYAVKRVDAAHLPSRMPIQTHLR